MQGDILFLHMSKDPIRAGEIVVFNVDVSAFFIFCIIFILSIWFSVVAHDIQICTLFLFLLPTSFILILWTDFEFLPLLVVHEIHSISLLSFLVEPLCGQIELGFTRWTSKGMEFAEKNIFFSSLWVVGFQIVDDVMIILQIFMLIITGYYCLDANVFNVDLLISSSCISHSYTFVCRCIF